MNGLELQIQRCEEALRQHVDSGWTCQEGPKLYSHAGWVVYLEDRLRVLKSRRSNT